MGDIYLTRQHLAFYKSNQYLIQAQGNWLLERWMFNCLVVYRDNIYFIYMQLKEKAFCSLMISSEYHAWK